jgi:antitoxin (DNA-binding transcriptional repressor) of toxin-antitoxin stability system
MIRLNTHEAKTHLSRYLSRVEAGETIILCRRNEPIAEIRPIRSATQPGTKRVFGMDEGKFELGDEFFAPLPGSVIAAFNGEPISGID